MSEHSTLDPDSSEYAEGLDRVKNEKIKIIDKKTHELIVSGFPFDGKLFSSTLEAQGNWSDMLLAHVAGLLPFPFPVTTHDDQEYSLADGNSVVNFVMTQKTVSNSHYASGRALKLAVKAATDEAGVAAVEDLR